MTFRARSSTGACARMCESLRLRAYIYICYFVRFQWIWQFFSYVRLCIVDFGAVQIFSLFGFWSILILSTPLDSSRKLFSPPVDGAVTTVIINVHRFKNIRFIPNAIGNNQIEKLSNSVLIHMTVQT